MRSLQVSTCNKIIDIQLESEFSHTYKVIHTTHVAKYSILSNIQEPKTVTEAWHLQAQLARFPLYQEG